MTVTYVIEEGCDEESVFHVAQQVKKTFAEICKYTDFLMNAKKPITVKVK